MLILYLCVKSKLEELSGHKVEPVISHKGIEFLPQNSDFLIPITKQPVYLDLWYFKLLILVDQIV